MSSTVNLDVGPVTPASAVAWIEWADEILAELRMDRPSTVPLCAEHLDGIEQYFEQWLPRARVQEEAFRWDTEIDPDELEYLLCALFRLDSQLAPEAQRRSSCDEGRPFFLVLVRALLHGLETHSPGRAAFVDQLRSTWPTAAEVS